MVSRIESFGYSVPTKYRAHGRIGYFFGASPCPETTWVTLAALDDLSKSVVETGLWATQTPNPTQAFGRFVVRDLMDLCDLGRNQRVLRDADLRPVNGAMLAMSLTNRRSGGVRLTEPSGDGLHRLLGIVETASGGAPDAQTTGRSVLWYYQWLVVNQLLPRILDRGVMAWLRGHGTPLYDQFYTSMASVSMANTFPIPLEFQAAAQRFSPGIAPAFHTGAAFGGAGHGLVCQAQSLTDTARDTLRWGFLVSLHSAETCLAALNQICGLELTPLSGSALASGRSAIALSVGNMTGATPLWYYILREAQHDHSGLRLGPLGSHLVGQTLLGVIKADQDSYWHQAGSDNGRWHPRDVYLDGIAPDDALAALSDV